MFTKKKSPQDAAGEQHGAERNDNPESSTSCSNDEGDAARPLLGLVSIQDQSNNGESRFQTDNQEASPTVLSNGSYGYRIPTCRTISSPLVSGLKGKGFLNREEELSLEVFLRFLKSLYYQYRNDVGGCIPEISPGGGGKGDFDEISKESIFSIRRGLRKGRVKGEGDEASLTVVGLTDRGVAP